VMCIAGHDNEIFKIAKGAVGIQLVGRIDGSAPCFAAGDGKPRLRPSPGHLARKERSHGERRTQEMFHSWVHGPRESAFRLRTALDWRVPRN
jgi:hypothetical protein